MRTGDFACLNSHVLECLVFAQPGRGYDSADNSCPGKGRGVNGRSTMEDGPNWVRKALIGMALPLAISVGWQVFDAFEAPAAPWLSLAVLLVPAALLGRHFASKVSICGIALGIFVYPRKFPIPLAVRKRTVCTGPGANQMLCMGNSADFRCVWCSMAASPSSWPIPDWRMPPKGTARSSTLCVLTQTVPALN